jgi:protein-S-isoprenylcysteine O-methyltransferase Ste14
MSSTMLFLLAGLILAAVVLAGIRQYRRRIAGGLVGAEARAAQLDAFVDATERFLIVVLAMAFAVAAWRATHQWNRLMIIPEAMTVLFVLFRRQAVSVSTYPVDWALGVLGTMFALLARPGGEPLAPEVACAAVILAGTLISVSAKLSLNTRFALAPANRGIQPSFAYALVRHPMYAGYIVADVGFALLNPTPRNLMVYAGSWGLLVARIYREERWLSQDDAYVSYSKSVRWRLFPGVY